MVITETARLKIEYELTRLGRYKDTKQNVSYTDKDLAYAYYNWAMAGTHREYQWDLYCDIRDRVPEGTNSAIRRERARQYH